MVAAGAPVARLSTVFSLTVTLPTACTGAVTVTVFVEPQSSSASAFENVSASALPKEMSVTQPRFSPAIVTSVPCGPVAGEIESIFGSPGGKRMKKSEVSLSLNEDGAEQSVIVHTWVSTTAGFCATVFVVRSVLLFGVKLYCVPSFDRESWTRRDLPLEERARRHGHYEWWILTRLVPFVQTDSHTHEILATGTSFGAYHAANFCLKRADLFPLAVCMSGVYDVSVQGGGERGEAVYFNNPMDYVSHLHGDHLEWLRGQASLVLVCGRGQWEDDEIK